VEELRVAQEEMCVQNEALHQSQQSFQNEHQRYLDLLHFAPDAYLVTDLQGVIQEANRAALALLNAGPRSLLGKPLAVFVPQDKRQAFRTSLSDAGRGSDVREHETWLQPPKAPPLSVVMRVAAIRTPSGNGGRTERGVREGLRWLIRADTRLREAELGRYERLVEEVEDYAIFLMDANGQVLTWNAGAARILGYGASEIIGQSARVIFTLEDREAGTFEQERQQAAATGRAEDEHWHLRKDGSRFWASGILTVLRGSGGQVLWYAKIMRDLTERKQEEERLRAEARRETHIATRLQAALLPSLLRSVPGLGLAHHYRAAWGEARVGGDFADVSLPENGCSALAVGDLAGKGLGAAAEMSVVRNMLRYALYRGRTLAGAVGCLNALLIGQGLLTGFCTLFVGTYDAPTRLLTYVNCGQEPALVWRAETGEVEELGYTGPMLGLTADAVFEQRTVGLSLGDMLVMFTDGLTDIGDRFDDLLGTVGVAGLLREQGAVVNALALEAAEAAEVLMTHVLHGALSRGTVRDDLCLLVACAE
jgi:PAS domain S-box-containing protein